MESVVNPELQLAFDFVQYTNRNIFLTGKAGTGKTTFLHNLKRTSPKRMIVVAPTGVAAINAGGVTIHSFFQLPFHPHVPLPYVNQEIPADAKGQEEKAHYKLSREKINILKSIDLLVIDEISMVRADLLDAVDAALRRYKLRDKPFGGVQLLMIGDIQQLAPVVTEEDREVLDRFYDTPFFFGSFALRSTDYVTIELKHIYRQRDLEFIHLLNKIRDNRLDAEALAALNKRHDPHFRPDEREGYITLTTHNHQAQTLNASRLEKLPGAAYAFMAEVGGEFPEYAYPADRELLLKTGAQVMFVKNDISREKRFFNGKIGRIMAVGEEIIEVKCPGEAFTISVERTEWQNMKYALNPETREIDETVIGTFLQYPLKLAWAITIHKSQGLTFDKAIIDARSAFAHGQVYVALSRCRTLEGVVLSTPVNPRGIINDPAVSGFVHEAERNQPDHEQLQVSKKQYQYELLTGLFDFTPLMRELRYFSKLFQDHRDSLIGQQQYRVDEMIKSVQHDLIGVAEKFGPQWRYLMNQQDDAEINELLQERLKRACNFFHEKLSDQLEPVLRGMLIETDNKEVRKILTAALEKIRQETHIKMTCLETVRSGFRVNTYLTAKAKAAIELPSRKTSAMHALEDISGEINHPVLYSRLKAWREQKAGASGQPHYMIIPQSTLATLVNFLPQSMEALRKVKGMGKVKSARYGEELIELIGTYCKENNLESSTLPTTSSAAPANRVKIDTRSVSYHLFKGGKTVQEIAAERRMAASTIEGHLAYYVGTGDIPVSEFVSRDIAALIASHFEGQGDFQLRPVKAALGERVSWSELRFVVKYLEFLKKPQNDRQKS